MYTKFKKQLLKKQKSRNVLELKMYSPRVIKFFTVGFVAAIIFGLIGIFVLDLILGPEEPLVYAIAIIGLAFAAFIFAFKTSFKKR